MLREAGAKRFMYGSRAALFTPLLFWNGFPDEDSLIAHNRSIDEIRDLLGADSLSYLNIERLNEMAEGLPICTACFSGNYPIEPPKEDIRGDTADNMT